MLSAGVLLVATWSAVLLWWLVARPARSRRAPGEALRERRRELRRMVLGDAAIAARLEAHERERDPAASDLECVTRAIERCRRR